MITRATSGKLRRKKMEQSHLRHCSKHSTIERSKQVLNARQPPINPDERPSNEVYTSTAALHIDIVCWIVIQGETRWQHTRHIHRMRFYVFPIFNCPRNSWELTTQELWRNPVEVDILKQWWRTVNDDILNDVERHKQNQQEAILLFSG